LPYISQPFLASTELDQLIRQLRSERYFDIFSYYPANASWACIRCIDDAEDELASGGRETSSPVAFLGVTSAAGLRTSLSGGSLSPNSNSGRSSPTSLSSTSSGGNLSPSSNVGLRTSASGGSLSPSSGITAPASPLSSKSASLKTSKGMPSSEETIVSGVLKKKGKVLGNLKDRWCVLTTDHLFWASSKEAPKKRGSVLVKDILNVQEVDSRVVKSLHSFKVVTRKQTYILSASSAEEHQRWIRSIKNAIAQV